MLNNIQASYIFQDNFFDFIYVDANHKYKSVISDLIVWYPKLKRGGIMSGHDYVADYSPEKCDINGDTHVWLNNNGKSEYAGMFGVNKAVEDFCNFRKIKYETTTDEYLKTWFFKKEE